MQFDARFMNDGYVLGLGWIVIKYLILEKVGMPYYCLDRPND